MGGIRKRGIREICNCQYDDLRDGIRKHILVKVETDGNHLSFSTFSPERGSHGRFLIQVEKIRELVEEKAYSLCDMDCGNHVYIWSHKGILRFTFDWLSAYGDGTLKGIRQHLELPAEKVISVLVTGKPLHTVYRPDSSQACILSGRAIKVIREMLKDKRKKRAFSKAMRDCFQWRGDTVSLYPDSRYSFYFRTASGFPSNGGLILHEDAVRVRGSMFPKLYYGVHT